MTTLDNSHILYKERFNQFQSFANLKFGKMRPIDIDGYMEVHNKLFIFIESKTSTAPFSTAQRIALERLTDAIGADPNKHCYTIIARHDTPVDEPVDTGNSLVDTYRYNNEWVEISMLEYTVHDFIQHLLNTYIYTTNDW